MISIGTATELTTDELGVLLRAFAPLDLPDPQEVGHGQPAPESA